LFSRTKNSCRASALNTGALSAASVSVIRRDAPVRSS
jgi:hypothetical protein